MMGGIDQLIKGRTLAAGGNPQVLAQKGQQQNSLVDLLALQKLKSEKEAAAREMQMQLNPNPQTIAQQREQEVLGLTKQEMARTMAPGMQKQGQQLMQQQRMAGIGGLQAPTPAQAPPQQFSGGGIVAFAEGGAVSEKEIENKIVAALQAGGTMAVEALLAKNPSWMRVYDRIVNRPERGSIPYGKEFDSDSGYKWGPGGEEPKPSYEKTRTTSGMPRVIPDQGRGIASMLPKEEQKREGFKMPPLTPVDNKLRAAREKQTAEGAFQYPEVKISDPIQTPGSTRKTMRGDQARPEDFDRANAIQDAMVWAGKSAIEPYGNALKTGIGAIAPLLKQAMSYPEGMGGQPRVPTETGATTPPAAPQPPDLLRRPGPDISGPNNPAVAAYQDVMDQGIAGTLPGPQPQQPPQQGGTATPAPQGQSADPMSELQRVAEQTAINRMNIDPAARAEAARGQYQADTAGSRGLTREQAQYRKRMEDLLAQQQDPNQMRMQQLASWLRGAAGTSNPGVTFARAGASSANTRSQQESDKRSGIASLNQMAQEQLAQQRPLEEGMFGAGQTAQTEADRAITAALGTAGSMSNTDKITTAQRAATAARERIAALAENQMDYEKGANALRSLQAERDSVMEAYSEARQLIQLDPEWGPQYNKAIKQLQSETNPDKRRELSGVIRAIEQRVLGGYSVALDDYNSAIRELQQKLGMPATKGVQAGSGNRDFSGFKMLD